MKYKLGSRARDTITGYDGVITKVLMSLRGTTEYELQKEGLKDHLPIEPFWFDESRLELDKEDKVGFEVKEK